MSEKSLILVGNPDSGKTNFLARLWMALQAQKFALMATVPPSDIKYAEEILAHILEGKFAPRTDKEDNKREFNVELSSLDGQNKGTLYIPDASGEMWKKAVESFEIPEKWMKTLQVSTGALLFVRVLSELNVQPIDWINCQKQLKAGLGPDKPETEIPTQISLIELTRFLEDNLAWIDGKIPKVAVIISAWDILNEADALKGPQCYLREQFPMFAGRIADTTKLDIKTFGLSIVGGDLTVDEFINKFLEDDIDDAGYVVTTDENNQLQKIEDITSPLTWLLA